MDDEQEQASIKPEFRKLIKEPTQDEIDEHTIDHAVFRSWCPHCIHGQAVCCPHKHIKDRNYDIPIISTDYGYMNDEKDKRDDKEKGMPIIVLHDKKTGIHRARLVVPRKGVRPYAVDRMKRDIEQLGHK